ncbi:MAG: MTH1187 family thiamine-binding protein [Myxococcales bacterium]|nr:MTH1187 family thiamine-binding protein [Myxococcales bacterium]
MPIAQLTVVPLGTGDTSLSGAVAAVVAAIRDTGIRYRLTPMATVLEGSIEEILAAVRAAHEAGFAAGSGRVSTSLTIDDRRDKATSMAHKVAAVEAKMKD